MIKRLFLISSILVASQANAALVGRLAATEGGTDYQAYYDDVADLTWLADANAAGTAMNWTNANNWAAGLSVGGFTGWRLPNTIDVGNDGATYTNVNQGVDYGYNITTHSELSNMFYNVLGNTAYFDTSGVETGCSPHSNYCLTNTGPFSNLQFNLYWSATEYAPDADYAWQLYSDGLQSYGVKAFSHYAWAVHSGDVSAVPVPSAVWLFASGLIGLIGFARKK